MGGCFSDMKGGKQAVGANSNGNGNGAHNDAVDFFYKSQGFHRMFTQIELSLSANNLLDQDIASKTLKLGDQDFLGMASCTLSEIVTKPSRRLSLRLQNKSGHGGLRNLGAITVHAEETVASRSTFEIVLRCSHLDNKDFFSKSDPFLRISRLVEIGGYIPICKTEVINDNLNPIQNGNQFVLVATSLEVNSWMQKLLIPKFIAISKMQKSVTDLEKLYKERTGANFVIPSTRHRQEKVLKGQLFVDQYCEKERFSFIDYISNGFELNFMVAVDFTASNGNPQHSGSLHYIDAYGRLNSYQKDSVSFYFTMAIMEVGEVIQFYDSDRRFLLGALEESYLVVVGVEGIMDAYASALRSVTLSGPTLFGPVINMAATNGCPDGIVTDLQETINALVKASDLPMSILIVGVGNADFTSMEVYYSSLSKCWMLMMGRSVREFYWSCGYARYSAICPYERSTEFPLAPRCSQTIFLVFQLASFFGLAPHFFIHLIKRILVRFLTGGQISVVQALLEELPEQFLSFMRSRDIKPLSSISLKHPLPPCNRFYHKISPTSYLLLFSSIAGPQNPFIHLKLY
ncbi:hypothetical protein VNO77_50617 [Canavalia gladiata]|uniref:Copine C-terminal domain-containing protein n=1 Tax=Canavalia gladiata TaxID=3824 RepID=A0AAN9JCZ2_CANGL